MEILGTFIAAHGVGILLGAAGGYAYYRFIGCKSGACPITANPWISTLYGAVVGGLLSG